MPYQRKILRLKNYNYSANGAYFLTICTKGKQHFFGEIKNDTMYLSEYGHLAKKYWEEIPQHFENVIIDIFG
jgi:REP element-mobilizing transposase RayT